MLREIGFRIWLDDFGSGYTSLSVLKEYDFDLIKIDMRFLSNMSLRSKKLINAVVNTAKTLGIHTLAEGAETEEHISYLREIGCENIQGYYYARPMPADGFIRYLTDSETSVESNEKRFYMETVGMINLLSYDPLGEYGETDADGSGIDRGSAANRYPIALLESSGEDIRFLYANEAYKKQLSVLCFKDLKDTELQLNDRSRPFWTGTLSQMNNCRNTRMPVK